MPRVAIAYTATLSDGSRDAAHAAWVEELATRLRAEGIDARLDEWHAPPGTHFPTFNQKHVVEADFVLFVCTPAYKQRFDGFLGGVGDEAGFVGWLVPRLAEGLPGPRFVPLLRQGEPEQAVPALFADTHHLDLRADAHREQDWRRLLDLLQGRVRAPELGLAWWRLGEVRVELEAGAEGWTLRCGGEVVQAAPVALDDAGRLLRALACQGYPCDAQGHILDPQARLLAEQARREALDQGQALAALLPAVAWQRLAVLGHGQHGAVLRLAVSGPAAEQALALPWELLSRDEGFLLLRDGVHLVRELVVEGAEEPAPEPGPLRVVAHVAAPEGEGVVGLNLEEASYRMARALDPLRDRVLWTELGTLGDLGAAVERHGPSLLHLSGHGSPGHLVLEDLYGGPRSVPIAPQAEGDSVVGTLRASPHPLPRAAWLSCCFGAGGRDGDLGPWPRLRDHGDAASVQAARDAGMAVTLHRQGVAQVLGYFGPVPDPLAVEVDRTLFRSLVGSGDSWQAVRAARRQVADHPVATRGGRAVFPLAWSLLALYQRGPRLRFADVHALGPDGDRPPLSMEPVRLPGLEVPDQGFIGRRRLLGTLRAAWRGHGQPARRGLGLYGMGGLGKTATAARLARILAGGGEGWQARVGVLALATYGGESAPWTWLLDQVADLLVALGSDREAAQAELAACEARTDWGEAVAEAVLRRLGDRVLLVDNAETLQHRGVAEDRPAPWVDDTVRRFFSTLLHRVAAGTVIVTTRHRPDRTAGHWVEIPPAGRDQLYRMMDWRPGLRLLPGPVRELLAERLAGHPRSVAYLDRLLEQHALDQGLDLDPEADPASVLATLVEPALGGLPDEIGRDLVLDQLLSTLAPAARAQLSQCAAIARPVEAVAVQALGAHTETLTRLGLLTRYAVGQDAWAVHPYVAAALGPGERGTPAGRAVLGRYWLWRAYARDHLPDLVEAFDHLVAGGCWEEARDVLATVSGSYRHSGQWRARLQWLEAMAGEGWPLDMRHVWTYHLGNALTAMGRYEEAATTLQRGVALAEERHGTRQHASVAASLHGLGNVLEAQGRYGEAEAAYRESIAVKERAYGTRQHAEVAASLHGLGNVLVKQGRYGEAEAAYQESILVSERAYGTRQHAEVAASLHGLGNVQCAQGRYGEAEAAYQESILVSERAYGTRQHAEVAASLHGLANVLVDLGRYGEAEAAYQESILVLERAYGTRQHAEVAASLHGLAFLLSGQGRFAEAVPVFVESLDIQVRAHGSRRAVPCLATTHQLSRALLGLHRLDEALPLARDAWEGALAAGDLILSVQNGPTFVEVLAALDRKDDARRVGAQVVTLLQRLPPDHPVRREVEQDIGLSRPDPAQLLAQALAQADHARAAGETMAELNARGFLAQALVDLDRPAEAQPHAERGLVLARQLGHAQAIAYFSGLLLGG